MLLIFYEIFYNITNLPTQNLLNVSLFLFLFEIPTLYTYCSKILVDIKVLSIG